MGKLKLLLLGILAIPLALAMEIPTDETSFAQEIYIGIMRFFSGIMSPLTILLFLIFFVLIIILLGFLIKKILGRLRELAG
jgi:hypothetical protein